MDLLVYLFLPVVVVGFLIVAPRHGVGWITIALAITAGIFEPDRGVPETVKLAPGSWSCPPRS